MQAIYQCFDNYSLQLEALPQSVAEPPDGLAHVVLARGRVRGAEKEARQRLVPLGMEPGPACDKDALGDARVKDGLFNVEEGGGCGGRVERVVDLEPELGLLSARKL